MKKIIVEVKVIVDGEGLAYMDTIEPISDCYKNELIQAIENTVTSFLIARQLKSALTNEEFARSL